MDIPIVTNGLVKQKSDVDSKRMSWLVHFLNTLIGLIIIHAHYSTADSACQFLLIFLIKIKKNNIFSINEGSGFEFAGNARKFEPTSHFIEKV